MIEGTGSFAITKMHDIDPEFFGTGRVNATLGTLGPLVDYRGFQVGGTSTIGPPPHCIKYDQGKRPMVPAGTNNGISITVIPTGQNNGGRAIGGISVTLIAG